MNRTYINEVQKEIGNTVKVQGSPASCRSRLKKKIILIWWTPSIS